MAQQRQRGASATIIKHRWHASSAGRFRAPGAGAMDGDAMAYLEAKRAQMQGMQQAQALATLQIKMVANIRDRMQQLDACASMR